MRVLLDATAVIDATSTKSKHADHRAHYFRVWARHECYVTPITTSEVLHYIDRRGVGERRRKEMEDILAGCQSIPITDEIARHLNSISDQIEGLDQPGDMHDRWQAACADYHDLVIATRDEGIRRQTFLTII